MSGEILTKMSFRSYTDETFTKRRKASGKELTYEVMINPATFERTLGTITPQNKSARAGNSTGGDGGLEPESYRFDLYFDGTGAAGPVNRSTTYIREELQRFLDTVYAFTENADRRKKAAFVELTYCGESFLCKLSSMSLSYQLFHRDGNPLRIKASCTFNSVEKTKKEDESTVADAGSTARPPLGQDPGNAGYCCPCPGTPEQMEATARENQALSLMTYNYTPKEMSQDRPYSAP